MSKTVTEVLNEGAEMVTCSLNYFKGYTHDQLMRECEWLKNTSSYGFSFMLEKAEKLGWIVGKYNKKSNNIHYYTTAKGRKMIEQRS